MMLITQLFVAWALCAATIALGPLVQPLWTFSNNYPHQVVGTCSLVSCVDAPSLSGLQGSTKNITFYIGPPAPRPIMSFIVSILDCPSHVFGCFYDNRDIYNTFSLQRLDVSVIIVPIVIILIYLLFFVILGLLIFHIKCNSRTRGKYTPISSQGMQD